jgi:DDE domain
MGKGDKSTRMEKREGEGRAMHKSFSMLAHLADVGWRARCSESCTAGSGKGGRKRVLEDNALAAYFTALVQHYAPELEKRCKPHLKATTDSWRVDETYVKVKTVWMYLYRAVDSQGNTLEFLLSPTRDAEAAKRFFAKTLTAPHTTTPRVITVDKNAAYPKAFHELQAEGAIADSCDLRPVKYLNNIVEQDHRAHQTTRQTRTGLLFF